MCVFLEFYLILLESLCVLSWCVSFGNHIQEKRERKLLDKVNTPGYQALLLSSHPAPISVLNLWPEESNLQQGYTK